MLTTFVGGQLRLVTFHSEMGSWKYVTFYAILLVKFNTGFPASQETHQIIFTCFSCWNFWRFFSQTHIMVNNSMRIMYFKVCTCPEINEWREIF